MYTPCVKIKDLTRNSQDWRFTQDKNQNELLVMNISSIKFDNEAWFHENRVIQFNINTVKYGNSKVHYHPGLDNFKDLTDETVHIALDFLLSFAGAGYLIRGAGKAAGSLFTALKNGTASHKNRKNVLDAMQIVSGGYSVNGLSEEEHYFVTHFNNLIHPSLFAEKGYYDENNKLRFLGSIDENDLLLRDDSYNIYKFDRNY